MKEIIKTLNLLLEEAKRLYEVNDKGYYEAGRIDGIKWALEVIEQGKDCINANG